MTISSGGRLTEQPLTNLTRTRFSGGTAEFLEALSHDELASTLAPGDLDSGLFPSQFRGGTEDFLTDFDQVELSPLPAELQGLQREMHTWPLSRALPEVSFRSRLRRMASTIFSTPSGLSNHRSRVLNYTGTPSDFTEYTTAQRTHLFGPPDDTAGLEVQQLDPLPFAASSRVKASNTAKPTLMMPEKRVSSGVVAKEKTGNMLRTNSRRLMVLGALALTVAGMGLFTSGGGGAGSGNHKATATASALPNRPIDDYDFMKEFVPHPRPVAPAAKTVSDLGAPDGTVTIAATPIEPVAVGPSVDSKPAVLSAFGGSIILARGDSVWDKVSERLQATGISGDCELTNRTAQVVATLRAINPSKNLDVLSAGEHDLGFSSDLLRQVLADSSAC